MLHWADDNVRELEGHEIGEHYGHYRLHLPEAERAMAFAIPLQYFHPVLTRARKYEQVSGEGVQFQVRAPLIFPLRGSVKRSLKSVTFKPLWEQPMDLNQTITELPAEPDRIARAISQLESLTASGNAMQPASSTRGRKFMGEADRREVSERMKRYWASRNKAHGGSA